MRLEELIENKALAMFNAYYPIYYKKYHRTKKQVYDKFFSHFIKTSSLFCIRESFDPVKFIKAQTMDEFKFPMQFHNESAWSLYQEKLPLFVEKDPEVEMVENVVNAIIELKKYSTVEKWLSYTVNQKMVEDYSMRISPLLFAFSFSFIEYCDNNLLDYDLKALRNEVLKFPSSRKLIPKIQSFLKDDYYLFYEDFKKEMEEKHIIW